MGTNDYLIKVFFKKYLPTSILCVAMATITMTIDNILTGTLIGSHALAAMNVATPVYVLITLVASILSAGSGVLSAQYIGKNDRKKVNSIFSTTCYTLLLFCVVIIVIMVTKASRLAYLLGGRDEAVNKMTCSYIYGLAFGVIPIVLNSVLSRFSRILFSARILSVSVSAMSLGDIVLDVLFAGVLKMGMFGMALASSLSTLLAVMIMIYMMRSQNTGVSLCKPEKPLKEIWDILRLGAPDALNNACSIVNAVVANNILVILGGTIALSAKSVQSSVSSMTTSIVMGVGFTIAPFIGLLLGERDVAAMEKLLKRGLKTGIVCCAGAYVFLFLMAYPICRLFGLNDPETIRLSVTAIRLGSLSIIFGTINSMFRYYYQSIKRIWISNLMIVCKGCIYSVLCMSVFSGTFGLNAIWGSTLFAEVLTLLTMCIAVSIATGKWPRKMSDFMLLPKEIFEDYSTYEVSLRNNMDKVVELSRDVQEFCLEHGAKQDKALFTALCIEEMACNVVSYGFKDGQEHYMDIKVSVTEEGIVFRMRDDGKRFNPFQYLKEKDDNEETFDPCANVGIRIVKKLAKKVDYRYSVGLNYLFVTIELDELIADQ